MTDIHREPKPLWTWHVFGAGTLDVNYFRPELVPSVFRRILTRVFLGSKWTRHR